MKRSLLAALLLATMAVTARAAKVEIVDAWIAAAPPNATVFAGYLSVRNDGDEPIRILGAKSLDFGAIEMHETVEQDGIARMQALTDTLIIPGAQLRFEPGGKHLMLFRPANSPVREGETRNARLHFSDGDSRVVTFTIRRR
ncbi:MAG: copper chaperone PCu(A)C [Chromatiales bacterium]|nr:copper chaperone PCu(A)C [Chromatiales bacterium]